MTHTLRTQLRCGLLMGMARLRWIPSAVVVVLAVALSADGAVAADRPLPGRPAGTTGTTVTLVTGDRVTVVPGADGRPTAAIEAARWPGRRVSFHTTHVDGGLRVVPSDVARLVPGTLDPRLFDVTGLIGAGYDDASVGALPLIVRGTPTAGPAAVGALPGLVPAGVLPVGRDLPSIGATATSLSKARAAELGARLTLASAGGRGLAGDSLAGTHIWLDAKVRGEALDRNLTQVGAPAAWDAGLSGAGVSVAVLDTGVDDTHPDLAGRIVAEENFTDSPVADDRNGHGTHVASLVAGTGAAAAGARRGVAFGATVLSGKVLGDGGTGQFSWIIAGMEWAAASGVRVVNLSLGSDSASTGLDPLSLAVNELTESTGVLFVASAGNTGPAATTIGAPGAADAALTVGAVDRRDALAEFSGRGPRLLDHAIKPDLVAPGVDIIAARAAGTSLGRPVDARYTRLSGTSMAAPHVSGAAALLVERHPDWTPAMLKAVLVGTATPTPGSVYERGGGRLDLAAAIGQPLVPDRPHLSYGLVSYPQRDLPPIDRTFALANRSTAPVTVDLTAVLRGPDGRPAPRGMLRVAPVRLTLAAGATANVRATLAVALGGAGAFSGEIAATPATGPALRVPVGVVKESTRHVLRVHGLDRNGTSNVETLVTVVNLENVTASPDLVFMTAGEATVRVVPGFYTITAAVPTLEEGEPPPDSVVAAEGAASGGIAGAASGLIVTSVAITTIAEQAIHRDLDVTLDARAARPISARVRGVSTVPVDVHLFLAIRDRRRNGFVLGYDTSAEDVIAGILFVQPTRPVRHGRFEASSKWRLATVGAGLRPTYDLLFAGPAFPPSLEYVVDRARLARVSTLYRAPGVPVTYREFRQVFTDINPVSVAVAQTVPEPAPVRRTEYVAAGPDRQWFQCAGVFVGDEGVGQFCQAPVVVRRSARLEHDWLRAPLRTTAAAFRTPTALLIGVNDLIDDGEHSGSVAGHVLTGSFQLYRDGVPIAEGTDPIGAHPVPAGTAVFRLTRTVEIRPDLWSMSTVVSSAWTFTSAPPRRREASTVAPLLDIAVHLPVDEWNRVDPAAALSLDVEVSGSTGRPPRIRTVVLAVSIDDGASWSPLTLHRIGPGRYRATVAAGAVPAGGALSVRTAATDRDGNHTEQTILRAALVRGQ
jgi:subtilisin family serine protease